MNKVIISVHVPKTAGRSFAVWLESVVGSGQVVQDYDVDRPIDEVGNERRSGGVSFAVRGRPRIA